MKNLELVESNVTENEENETIHVETDNANEYFKSSGGKYDSKRDVDNIPKDRKLGKILLIILILIVIALSILIPTGVLQNVRTSKSYDTAKDFFYKEQYTNASKEIGITNELSKSVFINSDLKKNISALSTEISQYCALEKSKKAFYETKNIQEARLQLNLAIVNNEILKKEQSYIQQVVDEEYRVENRPRIEASLTKLMKEYGVILNYDNTKYYSYDEKVGICGVAEYVSEDTYSNLFIMRLTTYNDKVVEIYVGNGEWSNNLRGFLKNNKKIELACIIKPSSMYLYTCSWYKNRLIPNSSQ